MAATARYARSGAFSALSLEGRRSSTAPRLLARGLAQGSRNAPVNPLRPAASPHALAARAPAAAAAARPRRAAALVARAAAPDSPPDAIHAGAPNHPPVQLLLAQARLAALEDFRALAEALRAAPLQGATAFDVTEAQAHIARFANPSLEPHSIADQIGQIAAAVMQRADAMAAIQRQQEADAAAAATAAAAAATSHRDDQRAAGLPTSSASPSSSDAAVYPDWPADGYHRPHDPLAALDSGDFSNNTNEDADGGGPVLYFDPTLVQGGYVDGGILPGGFDSGFFSSPTTAGAGAPFDGGAFGGAFGAADATSISDALSSFDPAFGSSSFGSGSFSASEGIGPYGSGFDPSAPPSLFEQRTAEDLTRKLLALTSVMEDQGFALNAADPYDPASTYVDTLLDRRLGE
jgi:hypothetical protein